MSRPPSPLITPGGVRAVGQSTRKVREKNCLKCGAHEVVGEKAFCHWDPPKIILTTEGPMPARVEVDQYQWCLQWTPLT